MIFEKQVLDIYKNMVCRRCDDDGTAFYFSYLHPLQVLQFPEHFFVGLPVAESISPE